ncbi:VWA domain-containing protein [Marivirga sp. S37H4]|uniref:VWA domain-containing protein n=1 Tax=Marivirga aurantiaca TaxID=2802615 RepID=A0A934WX61_9BACT|nr:VWA domain-containing protein [Marivirga aurantiaca]MBK6264634.1 VWA domain-containing protein [Marivirga aurantiaca]
MTWINSLGTEEIVFIVLFLGLYLAYTFRVFRIAKRMGQAYSNVLPKFLLRSVIFALLIMALMGPSFGEDKQEVKAVGKDIMIAVDLSQSMNAFDIAPTRLEKVKYELKNIVDAFSSDRIGLLIFSSEAFVQCPLTYDQNALNLFIETLNTGLVPSTGTDFGAALSMAYDKLTKDEEPAGNQKSKIIILISDGEDFGDETDKAVSKINDSGIRLFTLGVGTEKGSKISTRTGYKKDRNGNEVISQLNSKSLKDIAYDADGKYFEINYLDNEVGRLIATVNAIEGELKDTKVVDVSANKFHYFLGIAFLLLLLDVFTTVKIIKI